MDVLNSSRHAKNALIWGGLFLVLMNLGLVVIMETRRPELYDPEYGLRLSRLRNLLAHHEHGAPLICALGSSRMAQGLRPDCILNLHSCDSSSLCPRATTGLLNLSLSPLPYQAEGTRPRGPSFSPLPPQGGEGMGVSGATPIIFNYGVMAGGPLMELCYLRRLLADGIHPDWLLVEVWPPYLLHEDGAWAEENRIGIERLRRGDVPLISRYVPRPRSLWRRWCAGQVQPWLKHRFFLLSLFAPQWLPSDRRLDAAWTRLDDYGWLEPCADLDSETRKMLFEKGRRIVDPALNQFRVGENADQALRELAALCRQEKIRLVFIFLPESKVCQGWYPPEAQAKVNEYLGRLSRECAVPIVNARSWIPDEHFLDGYHLSNQGAAAFSELVGQRVLQPLLAGQPLADRDLWPPSSRGPEFLSSR
jgi:hypothetical protein